LLSGEGTVEKEKLLLLLVDSDKQIQRMGKLIRNLLDVSSINRGQAQLRLELVDLNEIIQAIIPPLSDELAASGSELRLEIPKPFLMQCDRTRIEQVASNLVSNAIKYGSGKPICVSAWTQAEHSYVRIQDQGVGIPKDSQAKIFNRFERLPSTQKISGLGLGLYIVGEIVRAHGGNVRIDSTPGEGSAFTLELPFAIQSRAVN
jgi:signal transduction histidine kinase